MVDDPLRAVRTPRVLLAAFLVVILVALGTAAISAPATLGPYNPSWDGTSTMRTSIASDSDTQPVITSTTAYDRISGDDSLVIILAPRQSYTDADVAHVRGFLDRGGTVLIAEDRRVGTNELLAELGVSARIDGRQLRDPQQYYRDPALPIVAGLSNSSAVFDTGNISEFTLNRGTALRETDGTAIANTTEFAYLDANNNGQLDPSEPFQSYPVMSSEQVSGGRVIVVGDPSIFINQMIERDGNRALVDQLIMTHDQVVIDSSHAPGTPPAIVAWLWLHRTPWAQALLGGVGGALVVVATHSGFRRQVLDAIARVSPRSRSSDSTVAGLTPAERAEFLRTRHPSWDSQRIQRVANSITRVSNDNSPDEHE
jgi:hypothetical protein